MHQLCRAAHGVVHCQRTGYSIGTPDAVVGTIRNDDSAGPGPLDWNSNQQLDPSEALVTLRFLLGTFPADALTGQLLEPIGRRFSSTSALRSHLQQVLVGSSTNGSSGPSPLDLDGNGNVHPLQDGLLTAFYAHGGFTPLPTAAVLNPFLALNATVTSSSALLGELQALV